jgi:hypothetical protein
VRIATNVSFAATSVVGDRECDAVEPLIVLAVLIVIGSVI